MVICAMPPQFIYSLGIFVVLMLFFGYIGYMLKSEMSNVVLFQIIGAVIGIAIFPYIMDIFMFECVL